MNNLQSSKYLLPLVNRARARRSGRIVGSYAAGALWAGSVSAIIGYFWMRLLNNGISVLHQNILLGGILAGTALLGLGVGVYRYQKSAHKQLLLAARELDRAWGLDALLSTGVEVCLGKLTGSLSELTIIEAEKQAREIMKHTDIAIPLVAPRTRLLVVPIMLLIGLMALPASSLSNTHLRFAGNSLRTTTGNIEAVSKDRLPPNHTPNATRPIRISARSIIAQQNIERVKTVPTITDRRSRAQAQLRALASNLNTQKNAQGEEAENAKTQSGTASNSGQGQNNNPTREDIGNAEKQINTSKSFNRHFYKYSNVVNAYFLSWAEESRL